MSFRVSTNIPIVISYIIPFCKYIVNRDIVPSAGHTDAIYNDMLVAKADIKRLVVGYNHHFGHNKAGDFDFLSENGAGLQVVRVDQHRVESDKVSSTVIRGVIDQGDMVQAARLLGHPYIIIGRVSLDGKVDYQEREFKQLPPMGAYPVRIDGAENELIIDSEGSLRLSGAIPQSDEPLIIEFCR